MRHQKSTAGRYPVSTFHMESFIRLSLPIVVPCHESSSLPLSRGLFPLPSLRDAEPCPRPVLYTATFSLSNERDREHRSHLSTEKTFDPRSRTTVFFPWRIYDSKYFFPFPIFP